MRRREPNTAVFADGELALRHGDVGAFREAGKETPRVVRHGAKQGHGRCMNT